jgi:RES domain-containing protein
MGARLFGGRWNPVGTEMLYTSSSLSLALLEVMVHLKSYDLLRSGYWCYCLEFDDALAKSLPEFLGDQPMASPPEIGDRWASQSHSLALLVPSIVVPQEINVLLNPLHPEFHTIQVVADQPLSYDARLVK